MIYLLDIINKKTGGAIDDEIYLKCENLNDYSTTTRYPMEKYEPTLQEAKESYQIAKQVKEFICKKIQ